MREPSVFYLLSVKLSIFTEKRYVLKFSLKFLIKLCIFLFLALLFLQVQENSPGHRAGLEPFFDFIVSINGSRLVSSAFCSFDYIVFCNLLKLEFFRLSGIYVYSLVTNIT